MKVPKIRFKGFGGDWRKRKLGDSVLLNRYKQISAEELQKLNEYHWDIALLPSSKNYDRKCNFYESLSNLINDAEIITVWRARNANTKYYKWKFIASQNHIIESFNNNEVNTKFLYLFILQHDKEFYSTESTYPMFTKQDFNDINLYYPNKQEQEKIWSLFEQLDSHISKNQQKLEKLKNMKQSFLQKLFPKTWATVPELRFKGFEGDWEEKKLNSTCTILKWQQINKESLLEYWKYYVLNGWKTPSWYIDKFNTTNNTISISEWWNSCGYVSFNKKEFWSWWHNYTLKSPNINVPFLFQNLKWKEQKIMALRVWSGLPNIQKNRLEEFIIWKPSLPEQEKIWAFFEKLDTQITQQSQKIQKLQNLKQSLLEKMFI